MEPTKEELAQLELGIADMERRISERASRVSSQPGAFASIEVLHFMEQTTSETMQMLADHAALSTTQRYIEADVEAQRKGRRPYLIMRVLCIYCTTADGGDGGTFATAGQLLSDCTLAMA